jgi:predicted nucleic-acid-binding protein
VDEVIALDTNVLVRLLVRDDDEQVRRALALLQRCRDKGDRCYLTAPVLCELEWVLRAAYDVPRAGVAKALAGILADDVYEVEEREAVAEALERYGRLKGGFSDYLIGSLAHRGGAAATYTFDRKLRRDPGFAPL